MSFEWQDDAACQGMDTELFFPNVGETSKARAAKAICGRCPVTEECALFAIETNTLAGIWGGLGREARLALGQLIRAEQEQEQQQEQDELVGVAS